MVVFLKNSPGETSLNCDGKQVSHSCQLNPKVCARPSKHNRSDKLARLYIDILERFIPMPRG